MFFTLSIPFDSFFFVFCFKGDVSTTLCLSLSFYMLFSVYTWTKADLFRSAYTSIQSINEEMNESISTGQISFSALVIGQSSEIITYFSVQIFIKGRRQKAVYRLTLRQK